MEKRRDCYLFLDFHVKTGTRISVRYKHLFEKSEVEITKAVYQRRIQEISEGFRFNHITVLTLRIRTDRTEQTAILHTFTGSKTEKKNKEKCPKFIKFIQNFP